MQSNLINPLITCDKIISFEEYKKIKNVNEYILFGDNILEGITLLNDLVENNYFLELLYVVYETIDQPIYVFSDARNNKYAIKICGSYNKWKLPKDVEKIVSYIDLPDYIIYSIKSKKVIVAGENTETASVGNSQWQREGRKLGAAKTGVPFIYQTFYSGRDESQDTIREPNSLQVFNQLVYSIRYKVISLVAYFENNFDGSQTRIREPLDSKIIFSKYIESCIIYDIDKSFFEQKRKLEKEFYKHMINYIKEIKYTDLSRFKKKPRIDKDLQILKESTYNKIINKTDDFVEELLNYIYETDEKKIKRFIEKLNIIDFERKKFKIWSSYDGKNNIKDMISYLKEKESTPISYISRSSKVGLVDICLSKDFLCNKFPKDEEQIKKILDVKKYEEAVLMPLRIYKKSNGKLTFSVDPESGEIVAFSELFGYDIEGIKNRPVIGYCIVDTPKSFNIKAKKGTKLYKAIAEYVDILIINNESIFMNLDNEHEYKEHSVESIESTKPLGLTEEMAVVSTFLNQSAINSNWKLCFIHTHHSSWQELVIHALKEDIQEKINRVSKKVDLIIQDKDLFMIAEGKKSYYDIFTDDKIKKAMRLASKKIDFLYKDENKKFDAFIYNLNKTAEKDMDFCANKEAEKIKEDMEKERFKKFAFHESFVVIIVYLDSDNCTKFKLVYSPKFDLKIKEKLDKEFLQ